MTQEFLWWRDGVIYQIYPRSFADANGDGIGDLRGIIPHLDYLRELGVDGIWLSPIYPSPMKDFGYDVKDYCDIDPVFGARADFDDLLREAHARNIRVIMDMVMNHTSDEHAWFSESRSSRDNPKRDWYFWRDPRPGGRPPNNWQSVFGGSAWQFDPQTGQYYLHLFDPGQPDLNWRNPEVKQAMQDIWRFWLDRGVDGFRLDVAHMLAKRPDLPDNPRKLGLRAWDRQRHIHYVNLPETHAIWKEFRQVLDEYPERMAVAEAGLEGAGDYCAPDEAHLAFAFGLMQAPWNPRTFQRTIDNWERSLPEGAWPCWVLSNHDQPRHISRWGSGALGEARAKVAAALLLTLRGTPFLYYGEELGLRQGHIPRAEIVDPPGKRYWPFYKGRDGARTPMQWNAGPNAGFGLGKPWMRLSRDADRINVEREQSEPDSLLNLYRRLIALRKATPALRQGAYRSLIERPTEALVYLREHAGQRVLVCLNFAARPAHIDLSLAEGREWKVLLSTATRSGEGMRAAGEVTLYANEALLLERVP